MSRNICQHIGIWIASVLIVICLPAFSQPRGQAPQPPTGGATTPPATTVPPGGGTGTPGNVPGTRPTIPSPSDQQQQRTPFPDMSQRPIFLSGKVTLDDGTPPPESVVVERVCNGIARPEGYTDSKGHFSFQLGQNSAMMHDASYSSADDSFGMGGFGAAGQQQQTMNSSGMGGRGRQITERDLIGCELRAVLPGYRSDVVNLAGRRVFDNPEVGTIILHRMGNVEGTTISMTSLQAPKDAKKAFDKGKEALKKKKPNDAEKEFAKAVQVYPKYAAAWYELGKIKQDRNELEAARKDYEQSLAADAKYVSPYLQLAFLAAREAKWQDVADTTDRVIRLDPVDFPHAYFFNAVANYNMKKYDAAEKSAREAQKLDTQHRIPKVEHLLGLLLVEKHDYNAAAEQMRSYLRFAPGAQDAAQVRNQLAELEKFLGQTAKAKTDQQEQQDKQ